MRDFNCCLDLTLDLLLCLVGVEDVGNVEGFNVVFSFAVAPTAGRIFLRGNLLLFLTLGCDTCFFGAVPMLKSEFAETDIVNAQNRQPRNSMNDFVLTKIKGAREKGEKGPEEPNPGRQEKGGEGEAW